MVKFLSFTALSVIIVSADCHNWTITGTPGTAGTAGTRFYQINFRNCNIKIYCCSASWELSFKSHDISIKIFICINVARAENFRMGYP